MTVAAFKGQFQQDPVRLTLPSGPITLSEPNGIAGIDPATIVISVNSTGTLTTQPIQTGPLINYGSTIGAWWGRVSSGGYSGSGSLSIGFPGHIYEAQFSLISGSISSPPVSFGSFVRLGAGYAANFQRSLGVGTDTATVRLSFRRFGTTAVLTPTVDFNLTLTNT